jgi:hypothetical protein
MKEQTICAKVSPKLLTKADRLFTGTIEGRIIELLQNARRAGATEVRITNRNNNLVMVEDNGSGIQDFQKLLDLGSSGWDERIESGEDPAGVGLFSLAPRQVTIISENSKVVITKHGWTGTPVTVTNSANYIKGTTLEFTDEKPWDFATVEKHAVFAGIRVIVDGKYCHQMPFCGKDAAFYEELGCQIEVVSEMSNYHKKWHSGYYTNRVLVNFHGQIVELDTWPGNNKHGIYILVDLAQQTQIRLMLPARTRLVENKALKQLKDAIEIEFYRYYQRQKEHSLYYSEFLRAKELGIDLPEANPKYLAGLLHDEYDMVTQVVPSKDFRLSQGYLFSEKCLDEEYAMTNAHLLGALGTFETNPFVPVTIESGYMGYSWTKLPKVTKVEVTPGKRKLCHDIQSGDLVCVDSLSITVQTSDGKTFSSPVPMAVSSEKSKTQYRWTTDIVYVTPEAKTKLDNVNIWYHLGGYSDDGDTFETQEYHFEKDIEAFWNELIGPHESLRQKLISETYGLGDTWIKLVLTKEGSLEIFFKNGKREYIRSADLSN